MEAASVEVEGLSAAQGRLLAVADQHDAAIDDIAEFLAVMRETMKKKDYSLMLRMLTDVLLEGTQLLYLGDEETVRMAFSPEAKGNVVFLPGVMSRKKQIIPALTAMWG